MEITTASLMLYFAAWTIFYALLSKYIARLSKDEWVAWAKSKESDEELLEILEGVLDEIDDRMHEKLEQFQHSFLDQSVQLAKKLMMLQDKPRSKAITRENPIMGFVADMLMKRQGLEGLLKSPKQPRTRV